MLPNNRPSKTTFRMTEAIIEETRQYTISLNRRIGPVILICLGQLSSLLFITTQFIGRRLNSNRRSLRTRGD